MKTIKDVVIKGAIFIGLGLLVLFILIDVMWPVLKSLAVLKWLFF